MTFLKNDPTPCATLKQVFFDGFELVAAHNALKMGFLRTKNGSKMRHKRIFPNLILDHLGCTNG